MERLILLVGIVNFQAWNKLVLLMGIQLCSLKKLVSSGHRNLLARKN